MNPLPVNVRADRIVVDKSDRRLHLVAGGSLLKTYRVPFGARPRGHKHREGDEKTPEGTYAIDWRKNDSSYFRALHVSYPDVDDIARARAKGVPPGGRS